MSPLCNLSVRGLRYFLLAVFALPAFADVTGVVVGVADGDTVTVLDADKTQHKVRVAGIDAPEKAQPFGQPEQVKIVVA